MKAQLRKIDIVIEDFIVPLESMGRIILSMVKLQNVKMDLTMILMVGLILMTQIVLMVITMKPDLETRSATMVWIMMETFTMMFLMLVVLAP